MTDDIEVSFSTLWEKQEDKSISNFDKLVKQNLIDEPTAKKLKLKYFTRLQALNNWTVASHREYAKGYSTLDDFIPTGYYTEDGRPLIIFPQQSMNVITARTGHGKTQILVNWCIDAIQQQSRKEKYKPVIFISLEMTKEQLAQRIINNLIYQTCPEKERNNLPKYHRNLQMIIEKITDYQTLDGKPYTNFQKVYELEDSLIHDYNIAKKDVTNGINLYKDYYFEAINILEKWTEIEKRLYIFDVDDIDNNLQQIEDFLNNTPNSIIFLDYLQYIHTDQEAIFKGVKDICTTIKKSTAKNNQIVITAGQFNRSFNEDKNTYPEELLLTKLAEGSDIEKTSYNVFGLAYYTEQEEKHYYLKVMKQREGSDTGKSYKLSVNLAYSYITPLTADNKGIKEDKCKPTTDNIKKPKNTNTSKKSNGRIEVKAKQNESGAWEL